MSAADLEDTIKVLGCLAVMILAASFGIGFAAARGTEAHTVAPATPTPQPTPMVVTCILDSAQIARLVTCYEGGCFTPVGAEQ